MMRIPFLLWLVACSRTPEEPVPEEVERALPHVVLVTLDTTRADRIGAYGYAQAHTPSIDALAGRGRRYAQAYSPLPLTIPAHASLLTGLYPPHHGVRDNGGGVLSPELTTLPEILHEHGYHTVASVSAFVTTRMWGFDQGFDAYFDALPEAGHNIWHQERPAAEVVDDLLAWRAEQPPGMPQFAWVHFYDAHAPYLPPPAFLEMAEGRPYDGELAYVDTQVARVVEAFAGEPTLFVLVGDHGEGLGDHGEIQHGLYVYDATQRVPWVIAGPGVEPGVVEGAVSTVDLVPTLLDLLGLPVPTGLDGRVAPGDPPRAVYMETYQLRDRFGLSPHVGVVDGVDKLVLLPRPELYDMAADPRELQNRAGEDPGTVERLSGVLEGFGFSPPPAPGSVVVDPEVALQLQQLGYVHGTFVGDVEGPLPDPKDHRALIEVSEKVGRLRVQGEDEEAAALLAEMAAQYPDVMELQARRASLLSALGRREEAMQVVRAAYERNPHHDGIKLFMAQGLAAEGKFEEAAVLFREAADDMPWAPGVRAMAVAALLGTEGGRDEALALGLEYLAAHPMDDALAGLVGLEILRRGDAVRARPLLEQGLRAQRPPRGLALHLGLMAQSDGDLLAARALMERELDLYPRSVPALRALYVLYATQEDWKAEVGVVERLLALEESPVLWHAKAQAQFNLEEYAASRETLDAALARYPEASILILLDANLLAKEGQRERAEARFEEAKRALEREGGGE